VNSFWSYLVFVGETNIFMIAGVMVGSTLPQLSLIYKNINIHSEVLSSFYIYLFAVVARFTSISVFIKYLRRLGEGLNWKEIILLTVAGLKGAIGIALAMQIFKSKDFSEVASYLVMIHVTANSLLTLIIHGLSAGLMVKILGLSSLKKV
jgi:NhaP-type Na+/H+ or K+/H+ antiporter